MNIRLIEDHFGPNGWENTFLDCSWNLTGGVSGASESQRAGHVLQSGTGGDRGMYGQRSGHLSGAGGARGTRQEDRQIDDPSSPKGITPPEVHLSCFILFGSG